MAKLIGKREYGTIHINSNSIPFNGRWVLRKEDGSYVDHDKYRSDLKDRYTDYDVEFVGN